MSSACLHDNQVTEDAVRSPAFTAGPEQYECPYCTKRHVAPIDPSLIACCGEVGHCEQVCQKCDAADTYTKRAFDGAGDVTCVCTACHSCGHEWGHA